VHYRYQNQSKTNPKSFQNQLKNNGKMDVKDIAVNSGSFIFEFCSLSEWKKMSVEMDININH